MRKVPTGNEILDGGSNYTMADRLKGSLTKFIEAMSCMSMTLLSNSRLMKPSCAQLYVLEKTLIAPSTVFLGKSEFYSSGLDLSTLEVRSERRSHSELSGTGWESSWK